MTRRLAGMFLSETSRQSIFRWRYEAEFHTKLMLALALAALTGAGAHLRLYLPFTPVPVTGQVFFVLLSGMLLGRTYGTLSMLLYVALGALGMPWFAGGRAGVEVLLGATGGYLLGFILAAFIVGHFTDNYTSSRRAPAQVTLMLAALGAIYLPGVLQLMHALSLTPAEALAKGVLPYIPGDLLKLLGAAGVGALLLPRSPLGNERDLEHAARRKVRRATGIAAAVASGVLLLLYWVRLMSLPPEATTGEVLWYSATYTLGVVTAAGIAYRQLRAS